MLVSRETPRLRQRALGGKGERNLNGRPGRIGKSGAMADALPPARQALGGCACGTGQGGAAPVAWRRLPPGYLGTKNEWGVRVEGAGCRGPWWGGTGCACGTCQGGAALRRLAATPPGIFGDKK